VKRWWDSLSDEDKQRVVRENREQIGNLNGAPVEFRSEANVAVMGEDLRRITQTAPQPSPAAIVGGRQEGLDSDVAGYRLGVAITEIRQVVIDATPDEIMDVLVDVESLAEWSSAHQKVEVLERDDQGRPRRARQVVKIVGVSDEQVLDYVFHDHGVSWTLVSSTQQRAQEGRYTLTQDGDSTRVSLELTVDPVVPLPGFLVKKGAKGLMETATDGLRNRVMQMKGQ
jgi:hypothetical protein